MAYTQSDITIDPRDPALDYQAPGPGLYPDETALRLDSGQLVAVSMRIDRDAMSQGFTLLGWVRAIDDTGQTLTDMGSAELEIEHRHTVDAQVAAGSTPEDLAREFTHAMLGEDNSLALADEVADSINIRLALAAKDNAGGEVDMGALLFGQGGGS